MPSVYIFPPCHHWPNMSKTQLLNLDRGSRWLENRHENLYVQIVYYEIGYQIGYQIRRANLLYRLPQNSSMHGRGYMYSHAAPPKKGILHKNSLASCQRYCHSVKSRALVCPFKQSNLSACHCWVDTPHLHTIEGDSVLSKLFLPAVMVTPSDSNYVNRSASLKRFSWLFSPPMNW